MPLSGPSDNCNGSLDIRNANSPPPSRKVTPLNTLQQHQPESYELQSEEKVHTLQSQKTDILEPLLHSILATSTALSEKTQTISFLQTPPTQSPLTTSHSITSHQPLLPSQPQTPHSSQSLHSLLSQSTEMSSLSQTMASLLSPTSQTANEQQPSEENTENIVFTQTLPTQSPTSSVGTLEPHQPQTFEFNGIR